MAYLLGSEGDYAAASQSGLRALTIATSLGRQDLQVWTSIGLGRVYYAQGDYRGAIERMRWVAGALKDTPIDEPYGRSRLRSTVACRAWLALCLAGTGDFAEALAWGDEAVQIAEAVGNPHERVWAGYCLSRVHLARGDGGRAIPLLEKAMPLCEGRIPLYWPRVVASLGRALTMAGDLDGALPLLKQAAGEVQAIKLLFGHPLILVWTAAAPSRGWVRSRRPRDMPRRRFSSRARIAGVRTRRGRFTRSARSPRGGSHPRPSGHWSIRVGPSRSRAELGMAPLQARCHLSLGALHRRAAQAMEARGELSTAVEMLDEDGDAVLARASAGAPRRRFMSRWRHRRSRALARALAHPSVPAVCRRAARRTA
jgi:tetratricopeptide (TPR) repeat protein